MRTDLLIDDRTGIVRRLTRRPVPAQLPRSYTIVDSYLADTTRFCAYPSDTAGAGYAFADELRAVGAAVGEAVERYCGNLVPPGLRSASHTELTAAGTDAIDPDTLALFSPDQHAEPGFPCVPFTRDLTVEWASGVDLATGAPVAAPASLVWVSHHGGPRTNPIIQAGLATGPTLAAAHWSAVCEIVERDAMTMTWTGRGALRLIRPPDAIARLARGPAQTLTARFYAFPTDVGLPVVGALVRDATTGYLSMGMGAHPDSEHAMLKALGEAYQLQILLADYDDPDGAFARAAAQPTSPLKPWRADRDYATAYRADLRDAVDYGCHLQLHLDPTIQTRFETDLAASVDDETDPAELAADAPRGLDDLVARLTGTGHRVVGVDVTTADVAAAGLHVVRVLVPGYYSNSAAGLPFLGGARLPRQLASTSDGRPRLLPLPH
jgi:ribosomal protein S12 methylthiotransferase accessory factor